MASNQYLYYKCLGSNNKSIILPDGIFVRKRIPQTYGLRMESMLIGRKRFLYFLFHSVVKHLFTGKFIEYDLIDPDGIATKAVLISKVPIYDFLPEDGIHICFCETIPSKRGCGFYPLLLSYIINRYPHKTFFMVVKKENVASIKGIERAGFVRYAEGNKDENGVFRITDLS